MAVSKVRKWCEETAKEFECTLTHSGKEWAVIHNTKAVNNPRIVFRSKHLVDVQRFFLNEIMKFMGKKMGVRK